MTFKFCLQRLAMNWSRIAWIAIGVTVPALLMSIPVAPHDWGDDFSMYIMQAATYAGDPSYAGLYIYDPDIPMYAPPSYPPGFSLMLAPVFAIAGVNLVAMQYYMSFLLGLTTLIVISFSRAIHLSAVLSVLVACIVCFHTFSLELRLHILSDIPFTGLVFLFFYLHSKPTKWYTIGLAALAAVLTRRTGILLVGVWLSDILVSMFEQVPRERLFRNLKGFGLLLTGTLLAVIFFPLTAGYSANRYLSSDTSMFDTMRENYFVYEALVQDYFLALFKMNESSFWYLSWFLVLLSLTGVYALMRKKERLPVFFFGAYVLLILGYQYRLGGYRMIFPLIPLMWIFIFDGFQVLTEHLRLHRPAIAILTAGMGLSLASHAIGFSYSPTHPVDTVESRELFEAVRMRVRNNEVVLSPKPRALALFTRRRGVYVTRDPVRPERIREFIAKHHIGHMVAMKEIPHPNIDRLAADTTVVELVWDNKMYALYRMRE